MNHVNGSAAVDDDLLASFDRTAVDLTTDSATLVDKFTCVLQVTRDQGPVVSGILDLGKTLGQSIETIRGESQVCGASIAATVQLSEEGRQNVRGAAEAVASITGAIDRLADEFRQVVAASEEIVGVIRIIQEIANQTKMLSLNAAIEAARAGEFGHGFAVVANEVRGLANNTRASADDISSRVERIVGITRSVAQAMTAAQARVSASGELWNHAAQAFEEIADHARQSKGAAEHVMAESAGQAGLGEKLAATLDSLSDLKGKNEQTVRDCNEMLRAVLQKLAGLNKTMGGIDFGKPPVAAIMDIFEEMRANNIMILNSEAAAVVKPYIARVRELDGVVDRIWAKRAADARGTGGAAVTEALAVYRRIRNEAYDWALRGDFGKVRETMATRARPAFARVKECLAVCQAEDASGPTQTLGAQASG
ncbi:methyl-accepting chemotaxis protein [Telmatospirillum siberiense]|uniref:methyl-accepting chemotaxis protein n=1 Tax=Telmatospirillum siberiense TaxID=382514 RepID=UPI00130479AE|nr:methyl-accepting chemotaxis protein [Telmatospirillum siberiense]